MGDAVVLEYRRVGDLSTGRVYLDTGEEEQAESNFENFEFPKMLRLFAEKLGQYKDASGVWHRVDYPGLVPYALEVEVLRLFREDPVAAISSMCPPSRSPSTVIKRAQEEKLSMIPVSLRVGYDVLADAFGDRVYTRARTRTDGLWYAECPLCGIWTPILFEDDTREMGVTECRNPRCQASEKSLPMRLDGRRWAGYEPDLLLFTGSKRFYLPRAWNDDRSWVSWEDLHDRYMAYQKEKEAWSPVVTPLG